jgi:hypothetical protein
VRVCGWLCAYGRIATGKRVDRNSVSLLSVLGVLVVLAAVSTLCAPPRPSTPRVCAEPHGSENTHEHGSENTTTTLYRRLGLPPALRTPSFGVSGEPTIHRYQPASSLRGHEDSLVLEIGSCMRCAGFANKMSLPARLEQHHVAAPALCGGPARTSTSGSAGSWDSLRISSSAGSGSRTTSNRLPRLPRTDRSGELTQQTPAAELQDTVHPAARAPAGPDAHPDCHPGDHLRALPAASGGVVVPEVLMPFMGGVDFIGRKRQSFPMCGGRGGVTRQDSL